MSFEEEIASAPSLVIRQRKELGELLGFEGRNKYEIVAEDGHAIGFAAEQQKGFLGFLFRQALGHWRRFEIHFFDDKRELVFRARQPFRFFFARLEMLTPEGELVGALQQRFSVFFKRFDVEDARGRPRLTVKSPFWKLWTFPFFRGDREVAVVSKKWSGLLKEAFTDADNFKVSFDDPALGKQERLLVMLAGIFIDLQYFEKKANR